MTESVWSRVRSEISIGHKRLLMDAGIQNRDVTSLYIERLYYNSGLLCGVILVKGSENARVLRKELFSRLRLSVRVRALLPNDAMCPLLAFPIYDDSYIDYSPEEVVEVCVCASEMKRCWSYDF